ncbi:MAG: transglycosylase domain-containing protein [Bacillota bacterium]|nr:transglycosylase domain-containing protein [Bacillota bacterium]
MKTKKLKKIKPIRIVGIVALVGAIALAGFLGFNIYNDTAVFDADKLLSSGASVMYDSDGEVMYTYGSDENGTRENITYDDLPQVLVDAVVAAEDSRFFEHNGFDLPRIAKAAISNLATGGRQGGSTITQQLIKKTYFPNAERTYTRKLSEVFLAIQADKELSKEEILTLYLNKIYFGRSTRSIGIASACKYYFNKDVSELTLPEAAMLAGSLNSPYNYDPYYCLDKATKRRNTILNLMVTHGYITQEECDEAKQVKVENTLSPSSSSNNNSTLAAYVDLVTEEVKKRTGLDPKEVQMNIYTYCDRDTQELATAIANGDKYDYSDEDMRMGGAIQSSQDGRIVAIIGGRNYSYGDLNFATTKQQPGSSVKPFLDYGLAFENLDWCTGQTIVDEPYSKGNFKPKNWDGQFHGTVSVTSALENSWNIPAIKTYEEVVKEIGKSGVVSAMESIGIDMSDQKDPSNLSYAIGGWTTGISPLEMTNAYATISNNGLYTESHTINYVEIVQTGKVYNVDEDIQDDAKQSDYSKASAFMIREVMLDYTKNGSGNYAYLSGIDNVGAKTGTSNWASSKGNGMSGKSRDLWMSAYTPDYVCSVWMGFDKTGIDKGKTTSRYKAYPGKVVQMLLKHLQKNKSDKIYPSQPSTVIKDGNEYYKKGTSHSHHASETTEETTEEAPTENTDDTTNQENSDQNTTDQNSGDQQGSTSQENDSQGNTNSGSSNQGNTDSSSSNQGNQDSSNQPSDGSQNTNQ